MAIYFNKKVADQIREYKAQTPRMKCTFDLDLADAQTRRTRASWHSAPLCGR